MRKLLLFSTLIISLLLSITVNAQVNLSAWMRNANGKKASYWLPNTATMPPTYTFTLTTDSADVTVIAYNSSYVYIRSHGMTDSMGKYMNPGSCIAQSYTHKFPQTTTIPVSKTISPKIGEIGMLINGVPIYGLGDSKSWNGSSNVNNGSGVWNVEVKQGEGVSLDTSLGAHPQQQGAYHSHVKPYRLYKNTQSTQHSPLIGFAFDGFPVYGPYGYSSAMNSASAVTRMKTGYSLRNITTRTTLPYGVAASQTGPPVNSTYPIGTYCEDYEWLASNGGDLDKYNGRFCVTPEYPSGTYAYFVTLDAAGSPAFPYYIGIEYYGAPETSNFPAGPSGNGLSIPTSGVSFYTGWTLAIKVLQFMGKTTNEVNTLTWQLGEANGNFQIALQRSFDGINFTDLSLFSPQLNNFYQYDDKQPLKKNYYRLKITEANGTSNYSSIINLNNEHRSNVFVYPTVTPHLLYVQGLPADEISSIIVIDALGKKVMQFEKSNEYQATVNISGLNKGMYFITVQNKTENRTFKIFKQ